MAMTPKLITSSAPLTAALMVAALAGAVWFVAEKWESGANLVQPAEITVEPAPRPLPSTAPRAELNVPFSPDLKPTDPTLCASIADGVFSTFEPLVGGEQVQLRTHILAAEIGEYLRSNCANAIHQGDWHVTAQILGVGLVYEALEPQSYVYAPDVVWDLRAAHLVDVAVGTFDVRAPEAMCNDALRQPVTGSNAFTPLVDRCIGRFAR